MPSTYKGFQVYITRIDSTNSRVHFTNLYDGAQYYCQWDPLWPANTLDKEMHNDAPTTLVRRLGASGWLYLRDGCAHEENSGAVAPLASIPPPPTFVQQIYYVFYCFVQLGGQYPVFAKAADGKQFTLNWDDPADVWKLNPTDVPLDPRRYPLGNSSGYVAVSRSACNRNSMTSDGGSKWPTSLGASVPAARAAMAVRASSASPSSAPLVTQPGFYRDADIKKSAGLEYVRLKVHVLAYPTCSLSYGLVHSTNRIDLHRWIRFPVNGAMLPAVLSGDENYQVSPHNSTGEIYLLKAAADDWLEM